MVSTPPASVVSPVSRAKRMNCAPLMPLMVVATLAPCEGGSAARRGGGQRPSRRLTGKEKCFFRRGSQTERRNVEERSHLSVQAVVLEDRDERMAVRPQHVADIREIDGARLAPNHRRAEGRRLRCQDAPRPEWTRSSSGDASFPFSRECDDDEGLPPTATIVAPPVVPHVRATVSKGWSPSTSIFLNSDQIGFGTNEQTRATRGGK